MTDHLLHTILEYFPSTKWTSKESKLHAQAMRDLESFNNDTVTIALTNAKRSLARTFIAVPELVQACKTVQKLARNVVKIQQAQFSEAEIKMDQEEATRRIAKMSREQVQEAVNYCRETGALSGEVSAHREQWTKWTRGVVHAASIALSQNV
jgi:hypothetical protein